jgi:hypothetical protein
MMTIRDDQQAKRCRVDCQFMIGDEFANGFEIQAQLKDPDDVRFDRIQFPGDPTLNRLPDEQAPKLIQIRWIAKEMKPRKRYQFSLYMKGENVRTSTDWKTALGEMEFVFGSPPSGH